MKALSFAAPALPDGADRLRQTAEEVLGPRREAFDDFHARMGVTREHWYIQETPQGPLVIVDLEGHDLARTFQQLATSEHPFDRWFNEQARAVHGIDFTKPMPGPMPEQVLAVSR